MTLDRFRPLADRALRPFVTASAKVGLTPNAVSVVAVVVAALAAGAFYLGGDDPVFYYAKLGYQRDFFAFGKTALSVDVHQTNDQQEEGDEARAIGFQFVQNVDDWGMDAFFNFRNHSLERDGRSFDDLNIAMIGARVRF